MSGTNFARRTERTFFETPDVTIDRIMVMLNNARNGKHHKRTDIATNALIEGSISLQKHFVRACGTEKMLKLIDYLIRHPSAEIYLDDGMNAAFEAMIRALVIENKEHKYKNFKYVSKKKGEDDDA